MPRLGDRGILGYREDESGQGTSVACRICCFSSASRGTSAVRVAREMPRAVACSAGSRVDGASAPNAVVTYSAPIAVPSSARIGTATAVESGEIQRRATT